MDSNSVKKDVEKVPVKEKILKPNPPTTTPPKEPNPDHSPEFMGD